ncbi:MAG TPA: LrgB family protein [Tissierellia bacterium]|nr:LrgB family protein [Tissierellia bacterium]
MNKDFFMVIFYILVTIIIFKFSLYINKKIKFTILNPVLLSAILIIIILKFFNIPYSQYNQGGKIIASALGPIVVVLAVPLYKNRYNLMKNFIPIMGGVIVSIITSLISVLLLCKIFKIDHVILLSLLSKSITTPMAVESTKLLGGNEAITVAAVVITGLMGAAVAPLIIKYGKIKNNIAKGIGIGASSHAVGTTKAIEMNEEVGAASGLAMGVTGLATIIAIIIFS